MKLFETVSLLSIHFRKSTPKGVLFCWQETQDSNPYKSNACKRCRRGLDRGTPVFLPGRKEKDCVNNLGHCCLQIIGENCKKFCEIADRCYVLYKNIVEKYKTLQELLLDFGKYGSTFHNKWK